MLRFRHHVPAMICPSVNQMRSECDTSLYIRPSHRDVQLLRALCCSLHDIATFTVTLNRPRLSDVTLTAHTVYSTALVLQQAPPHWPSAPSLLHDASHSHTESQCTADIHCLYYTLCAAHKATCTRVSNDSQLRGERRPLPRVCA